MHKVKKTFMPNKNVRFVGVFLFIVCPNFSRFLTPDYAE